MSCLIQDAAITVLVSIQRPPCTAPTAAVLPLLVGKSLRYFNAVVAFVNRHKLALKLTSSLLLIIVPWINMSQSSQQLHETCACDTERGNGNGISGGGKRCAGGSAPQMSPLVAIRTRLCDFHTVFPDLWRPHAARSPPSPRA